ncbi:MAG: DUF433 domain-containing protein [Planctomycetes bacterium]|nr:DUF433 domain-containing protein [Planctomycetota bacterium]
MDSRIINGRIDGLRITVWDVLHYLEGGWTPAEILGVLPLTEEQVQVALDYIDANREYVMEIHRKIEERNARGNPPEIEAKLAETRKRMRQWLAERRRLDPEAANAGNPGGRQL